MSARGGYTCGPAGTPVKWRDRVGEGLGPDHELDLARTAGLHSVPLPLTSSGQGAPEFGEGTMTDSMRLAGGVLAGKDELVLEELHRPPGLLSPWTRAHKSSRLRASRSMLCTRCPRPARTAAALSAVALRCPGGRHCP